MELEGIGGAGREGRFLSGGNGGERGEMGGDGLGGEFGTQGGPMGIGGAEEGFFRVVDAMLAEEGFEVGDLDAGGGDFVEEGFLGGGVCGGEVEGEFVGVNGGFGGNGDEEEVDAEDFEGGGVFLDDGERVGAFDVELGEVGGLGEVALGEVGEFFDDKAPGRDSTGDGGLAFGGGGKGGGDCSGEVGCAGGSGEQEAGEEDAWSLHGWGKGYGR